MISSGQQVAAGDAGRGAVELARLLADASIGRGLLADALAQPFGCLEIVDAEHLLDAGVGDEGAGPCAVEILQLAHVLQDRPELDAIARH